MKVAAVILIVVAAVVAAAWFRTRSRQTPIKFESTEQFVEWLAAEAVKDASENNHVQLNYSVDSIKQVEQVLGGLHDQYAKNPASVSAKGLGSAYGAYIGEVIRRTEPDAHWQRDDEMGEKTYPIVWGPTQGHSYPMAWCAHRIENGPEDNVWMKYCAFKNNLLQKARDSRKR